MNHLLPIILFTFSTVLTPGPNNFMIMNSGLHYGIKKSLPHYFGIAFGFPLMVLLVALGLGAVFVKFQIIKQILKFIGSAYMLYLAWLILRSNKKANQLETLRPLSFKQAILFQWVNAKAWLMAVSVISIFTLNPNYYLNAILISLIYFIVCIPGTAVWLFFGKVMQKILKNETQRACFNILMAIAIVLSIILIVYD